MPAIRICNSLAFNHANDLGGSIEFSLRSNDPLYLGGLAHFYASTHIRFGTGKTHSYYERLWIVVHNNGDRIKLSALKAFPGHSAARMRAGKPPPMAAAIPAVGVPFRKILRLEVAIHLGCLQWLQGVQPFNDEIDFFLAEYLMPTERRHIRAWIKLGRIPDQHS